MKENEFLYRHIGVNEAAQKEMLQFIGYENIESFLNKVIPKSLKFSKNENLHFDGEENSSCLTEVELLNELKCMLKENIVSDSYIGMGYYNTLTPLVIQRSLLENPGWYTQYTPYQSEISQGRLESLLNFQTMVMDLTGMAIANASLLDEGTAAAEAMGMLYRATKSERTAIFVSKNMHPQTIEVLQTRAEPLGIEVVIGSTKDALDEKFFAALLAYPGSDGAVVNLEGLTAKLKEKSIRVIVASDLLSLCLLRPPGEWGADVVLGSSQRFGVPMGFGGPHAAFMACGEEYKRQLPGRVIGVSKDSQGNMAYRMAMQTREQHIRRDRATSNICTAQALLANMSAMYAVYHGSEGLIKIAKRTHKMASVVYNVVQEFSKELATELVNESFFDTITFSLPVAKKALFIKHSEEININVRTHFYNKQNCIGISVDEVTTERHLLKLVNVFEKTTDKKLSTEKLKNIMQNYSNARIEPSCIRTSKFLQHSIFNNIRTEQQMQRYITRLERKDISLVHSMIPLGSCTMKLNATAEMMMLSTEEVANIHPFAPSKQTKGYLKLIKKLENYLAIITGFKAVSLQPNSGAQGEYTGLLAIRNYHKSRGEENRNVILIPSSAHGTNPASAVMAGFKVVVIACEESGNIDFADVEKKIEVYANVLGGAMITYPSTYGVYEEGIEKICDLIHNAGGLVYMDGANMNAQVGYTHPDKIGMDVCHLNLHKTFAIPHGGGGPGIGPIGVNEKLASFLPGHKLAPELSHLQSGAVSSAPWGSASLLTISYAYIRMLGVEGLKTATAIAILNANYIKQRLQEHYEIMFTNENSLVAHEMVIDTRNFEKTAGIKTEDIAKRLMDYGFHSPTMSWPVAGTLMIEPTESEDKAELDRFCDALIAIRKEVANVEKGVFTKEDNPLVNAPHTVNILSSAQWNHCYSREEAIFPLEYVRQNKFWPAVSRVDNVYGDRNLICACPSIDEYK